MASSLRIRLPEPLASEVRDPVRLTFSDQATEWAYQEDYFDRSIGHVRLALALGGLLYGVFGLLDQQLIPEAKLAAWMIRFAVVCPILMGVFVFSYSRHFRARLELLVWSAGFVAGCGIIVMVTLASPPGNYLYYAGLLLSITFYFTFMRLRFILATTLAWIIFLLYLMVAIWINQTPSAILFNNIFFFVSFNITGMLACYSLESYMRSDFLQRRIIYQQTQQLRETLQQVEQRRREAEDISHLDPLTNLFNRRYFFTLVEYECKRDRRFLHDSSLLLLDLDHFKLVNDTFGHLAGDQVLQAIAQIIKSGIRQKDVHCRYGGEEFAILLPQTSIDTAIRVGQRLREILENHPIPTDKGLVGVTMSIGVASRSGEDEISFDSLIEQADAALYAAKKAGRNQVWESAGEAGVLDE